MADEKKNENSENMSAEAPGFNVLGQYIKDLSFENPGAPQSLSLKAQPQLSININVQAKNITETDFEVSLQLAAKSELEDVTHFHLELDYCGLFRLENIPKEHLHPIVMIECPRILFPFARQITADVTRNGGFPPLMVDPVDFALLYRQRMQAEMEKREQENKKPN